MPPPLGSLLLIAQQPHSRLKHFDNITFACGRYWYSAATIGTLVEVVRQHCFLTKHGAGAMDCAFISTPSVFFAAAVLERKNSVLLDFDVGLSSALAEGEDNFVFYDFNNPASLPPNLRGAFSCVLIDPPYSTFASPEKGSSLLTATAFTHRPCVPVPCSTVTRDVWLCYAQTAQWLLAQPGGLVIASTVCENLILLRELFGSEMRMNECAAHYRSAPLT